MIQVAAAIRKDYSSSLLGLGFIMCVSVGYVLFAPCVGRLEDDDYLL